MYKVVNAQRTAKIDAPSKELAAALFLGISSQRIYTLDETPLVGMYSVHETSERVAVFKIKEG